MRERFCDADTNEFISMWYYRNYGSSLCVEYMDTIIAFGVVVDNKIEYVAVSTEFSGMRIGNVLVSYMVRSIQEDGYNTSWLLTADNPILRGWYQRLGFEHSSSRTDSNGISGDIMVYRFRPLRKAAKAAKHALSRRA